MLVTPVYAQVREWKSCVVDGVPTLKCLEVVFNNILFMSSALVALILFIMFIVGSFKYLTSGGNPEKVKSARSTFTYAIVGLVLFMGAYLILTIIDILFLGGKGSLFRFEIPEFAP
jgi:heme O synthase-like polyprenyltransferase